MKMNNRKNIFSLITLSILMIFCLTGCSACGAKDDEASKTFPSNYSIAGVDVSGKTAEEAKELLTAAASTYSVKVTLNGHEFEIAGADLSLAYNEALDLDAAIVAANEDAAFDYSEVYTSAEAVDIIALVRNQYVSVLTELVNSEATAAATDETATEEQPAEGEGQQSELEKELSLAQASNQPTVAYDEASSSFVPVDGADCQMLDYETAAPEIIKAARAGNAEVSVEATEVSATGIKADESDQAKKVVAEANEYLALAITLHYELEGYASSDTTVSAADIANWLLIDVPSETILISEENVSTYCSSEAKKHDKAKYQSCTFHTASGGDIQISVPTTGTSVDANKLFEDVCAALKEKKSATINGVFVAIENSDNGGVVDFGGNYCEVDLTNQRAYVFRNHEKVVDTAIVSGCVDKGNRTPAGVYTIFSRDYDRYLNGPGYRTWVNYFCPFNGGIGFHDAYWRSVFGGTEYLYNGSHGCINMPPSQAKILYENVYVGMTVVCYGGVRSIEKVDQTFTGSNTINVADNAGSFSLGVGWQGTPEVSYSSSNSSVASVSGDGVVTVNGIGSCTITVSTGEFQQYNASSYSVTINVSDSRSAGSITAGDKTIALADNTAGTNNNVSIGATSTNGTVTYAVASNSNPDWIDVSVDASGTVTATSKGNAAAAGKTVNVTIKISAEQSSAYHAVEKTVTVAVTIP